MKTTIQGREFDLRTREGRVLAADLMEENGRPNAAKALRGGEMGWVNELFAADAIVNEPDTKPVMLDLARDCDLSQSELSRQVHAKRLAAQWRAGEKLTFDDYMAMRCDLDRDEMERANAEFVPGYNRSDR